ncbi:hypothetical protein AVEN_110630-1 [Araneus ventricosus]|uniref:Uncharacterized protein n=1 Tax=Araneus ventricosus TaxID=182803 RepID=A0A4Y2AVW7_ARAVE|nr:hypothetical protein AVEN_110630-1 [Araneus ventricosus]
MAFRSDTKSKGSELYHPIWDFRSRSVYPRDGRSNSSIAEAGVLMAITGHGPTPPEGGMHYYRQTASPNHYYHVQERKPAYLSPAVSHPRARGAIPEALFLRTQEGLKRRD